MSDWFRAEEVEGVYHFSKWVNTVFFKEEQDQVNIPGAFEHRVRPS